MTEKLTDDMLLDDPFDRAYLRKNYLDLGCADVLCDVFRIFLESSQAKLVSLKAALRDDALCDLLALAHGLKGEAGSVGGRFVAGIASAMEKAARNGSLQEIEQLMPELESSLESLSKAIRRELGE